MAHVTGGVGEASPAPVVSLCRAGRECRRLVAVAAAVAGIAGMAGCGVVSTALRADPPGVVVDADAVPLHRSRLVLHVARPLAGAAGRPLVVFASGDGGWFGRAIDMFRAIAAHGYPVVGFSSRAFLHIERPGAGPLDARQLAADYSAVIAKARRAGGTGAAAPVILAGWSRGAAFSAIAATEPGLTGVRGVVAVGLADGEDLRIDDDASDDGPAEAGGTRVWPWLPYQRLRMPGAPPAAVIQAEHDDYLPAARARALFGPDAPTRRFWDVPARNHRFDGGRAALSQALGDALAWVEAAARDAGVGE
ncbi:MAG: AcvB/VirJ family lysyl-phosphatidylglycerol hydrolase [Vicinamibacterales bacterium]